MVIKKWVFLMEDVILLFAYTLWMLKNFHLEKELAFFVSQRVKIRKI